ncbi:MAG: hypothetical protein ACOYJL_00630 [Tractidigestivibacter sp.]|jgi:glycine cleavage system aminomethyltransferase T|uniref:hypothetical protein n=1 Tax=Tractidigestivibacter sp. TaxID=2847320 RepID=UPI003D93E15F
MNKDIFNGQFKYSPYLPFDASRNPLYSGDFSTADQGGLQPLAYSGWRDEETTWHDSCFVFAGLNPTLTYRLSGPDSRRFLSENFTNRFDNLTPGGSRHALMVNEDGLLMSDVVVMCLADDEFVMNGPIQYLDWRLRHGSYDATGEDITGDVFLYQLGGPRSLEVLEAATQQDLHGLRFSKHCPAKIAGRSVEVLRLSMSGKIGYEVHGRIVDALPVYQEILRAGAPFGAKPIGKHAYWNAHTENGYPQITIHFYYAWETEPDFFSAFMADGGNYHCGSNSELTGSFSSDVAARYVNPYEIGWGMFVNLDHDFVGRDALARIKDSRHNVMVTLEWSSEDVADVWASQLRDHVPYAPMDGPEDLPEDGVFEYRADKVLCGERCVGRSMGRCLSWHYRRMISLAILDPDYADKGRELEVLWGDPESRQKRIRARVARFPYMDEDRNEKTDVSGYPSGLSR